MTEGQPWTARKAPKMRQNHEIGTPPVISFISFGQLPDKTHFDKRAGHGNGKKKGGGK